MKKIWVIISLVVSVLSIIYIVLSYTGIIRYITLHCKSSEKFAEEYKSTEKNDDKSRVVVSLSTTPKRLDKLTPVINSLLDQTVRVDEIALNIPPTCKKSTPKKVKDYVSVYKVGLDYGSATKLLPTLQREGEYNTRIIVVEDNMIYGKDFIETILERGNESKNKAVTSKGALLVKTGHFDESVMKCPKVNADKWIMKNLKDNGVDICSLKYSENFKSFK